MKKSKGQTVDLLYSSKTTNKKNPTKKNKSKVKKVDKEQINLGNEIIIGLTPKKEETKKTIKNNHKYSNKKNRKKNNKKPKKNSNKKIYNKPKKNSKVTKWLILVFLLIVVVILILLSSIFNIKNIEVLNNNKVSTNEIITLSGLQMETNIFKTSNSKIRNNIKQNPYIENVKIKRSLRGTITLEIQERIPTYMLKFANGYAYINNQGYILEISENPIEVPEISGFITQIENINEGERLANEDLEKLDEVIKIMESAKSTSLSEIINRIDISDSNNYILKIDSQKKTVNFGDCSNIKVKLLRIEAVIKQEKKVKGEIYFQDSDKTVFKEQV